MTDKDVLTQEEIDALLSGVDDGSVDAENEDGGAAKIALYDLTNQDRVVGGRLPTVELVAEKFSRAIRRSLPGYLKVPIEVGSGGVQVIKFSEYIETLYVPTCIKLVKLVPFAGTCLLTMDAKLIHRLVDRFFGGAGVASTFEGKEFSPTEKRIIDRIVDLLLTDFRKAWQEILPLEYEVVGDEVNPSLVNAIGPDDAILVTSFRLELDDGGGELHIVFPYAALEPFKQILDASTQQEDEDGGSTWRAELERAVLEAEVPLNCLIGETEIRLRSLLRMSAGDVLDLEMNDLHQVSVGSLPLFSATLGDSRGRLALEFNNFGQG